MAGQMRIGSDPTDMTRLWPGWEAPLGCRWKFEEARALFPAISSIGRAIEGSRLGPSEDDILLPASWSDREGRDTGVELRPDPLPDLASILPAPATIVRGTTIDYPSTVVVEGERLDPRWGGVQLLEVPLITLPAEEP